jgi:hypothetical protein
LGEKIMGDAHLLADLEADLGSSFDLLAILSKDAESDQERAKLLSINQALTAVAAKIDQKELTSRSDAVSALIEELDSRALDLSAIHQKAIDLMNSLDIPPTLLNGFANITNAVRPDGNRKPVIVGPTNPAPPPPSNSAGTASATGNGAKLGASRNPAKWTQISQPPPFNVGMMLLLTDGSVLCQAFQRNQWRRLIPSAFGRYADGQWENLCFCSRNAPSYYASAVLADGKVIMAGGELNWDEDNKHASELCAVELFDPLTATWSVILPPPGWKKIGDAPCCVLEDGTFLLGSIIEGHPCAVYNPVKASWQSEDPKRKKLNQGSICDEET